MDRIERTIAILNYLSSSKKSCSVKEMSQRLKIDKSSVSRVLSSLESLDWVIKLPNNSYDIGNKSVEFSVTVFEF